MTDTKLQAGHFDDVNMAASVITNANKAGMVISGVSLAGADIQDADVTGMRINGVLVSDLFAAHGRATCSFVPPRSPLTPPTAPPSYP